MVIYTFIEKWGGPKECYKDFFFSAVSPIGFVKNNVNYNYYDDKDLFLAVKEFIYNNLKKQQDFGVKKTCIVLGSGKNLQIFTQINKELGLFQKIYSVEHPRFIMQYKSREMGKYLSKYRRIFKKAKSGL